MRSNFELEQSTPSAVSLVLSDSMDSGISNELIIVFDTLFDSSKTYHERNKFILIFLGDNITQRNFSIILDFMKNDAIRDLHTSILNSICFITSGIIDAEITKYRSKIESILKERV